MTISLTLTLTLTLPIPYMRQLLEEDLGGEGLASEQTLQILRRVATGGAEKSVIAYADTIVDEAAGSGPPHPLPRCCASLVPTSA